MPVSLTETAATRVRTFLGDRADTAGLRFGVRRTGCSGWSYVMDVADGVAATDRVFESQGVRVIVDERSLELVDGTQIDYAQDGLNAAFTFRNPKVKDQCGCGESFNV